MLSDYYKSNQFDIFENYFQPVKSRSRKNEMSFRHIKSGKIFKDIHITLKGGSCQSSPLTPSHILVNQILKIKEDRLRNKSCIKLTPSQILVNKVLQNKEYRCKEPLYDRQPRFSDRYDTNKNSRTKTMIGKVERRLELDMNQI